MKGISHRLFKFPESPDLGLFSSIPDKTMKPMQSSDIVYEPKGLSSYDPSLALHNPVLQLLALS